MSPFDPTRILTLARILESGSEAEKISLVESIDPTDPMSSGLLMRALDDASVAVRKAAISRLADANVRPIDALLVKLTSDDDAEIREIAVDLQSRPDALNPLEKLIPMVENLAGAMGPMGGMLRNMVQTMRGAGTDDEREQLKSLASLSDENPAAPVVVQQALSSSHISVRLAALRKTVQLKHARVPESQIQTFLHDPSEEVRTAVDAIVRAGKVGTINPAEFREDALKSMSDLLNARGPSGGRPERHTPADAEREAAKAAADADVDPEDGNTVGTGDLVEGVDAGKSKPELVKDTDNTDSGASADQGLGGFDFSELSQMFGGGGPDSFDMGAIQKMMGAIDFSKLDMGAMGQALGGMDLSSALGGVDMGQLNKMAEQMAGQMGLDLSALGMPSAAAEPTTTDEGNENVFDDVEAPEYHAVDGRIYIVAEERVRDRMLRFLARKGGVEGTPEWEELGPPSTPPKWALQPVEIPKSTPGWIEEVTVAGLDLDPESMNRAIQAAKISEHIWGAAYADFTSEQPFTLVFHDAMLSRAEWRGETPGAWASGTGVTDATEVGHAALLAAFLVDPHDDRLDSIGPPSFALTIRRRSTDQ